MTDAVSSTPLVVVISAPSGAGKTTLCDNIRASIPNISNAVTCTTRKPRDGELDGVDYYFLGEDEFAAESQAGSFWRTLLCTGTITAC